MKFEKNMKDYKIAYHSDLHLNMNYEGVAFRDYDTLRPLIKETAIFIGDLLNETNSDIYIINGDISWELELIDLFLNTLKTTYKGLVFRTLGNHCLSQNYSVEEFINFNTDDYLPTNPLEFKDTVIYGNSGFFDFSFTPVLTDREIEVGMGVVHDRYFTTHISYQELKSIVPRLLKITENQIVMDKKKILITHYMPSEVFLEDGSESYFPDSKRGTSEFMRFRHDNNLVNGSDKYQKFLENYGYDKCYFGHLHYRIGKKILNGVEYEAVPFGTLAEWKDWGYSTDLYKNLEDTLIFL